MVAGLRGLVVRSRVPGMPVVLPAPVGGLPREGVAAGGHLALALAGLRRRGLAAAAVARHPAFDVVGPRTAAVRAALFDTR